jgi:hypothetical protein
MNNNTWEEMQMRTINYLSVVGLIMSLIITVLPRRTSAAENGSLPYYLYDRGTGIHTSLFGTYVRKGELLFYPFYEYTKASHFEYKPDELGYAGSNDFFGKEAEQEGLIYFAYGFSDRLMAEFESSLYTHAIFRKAPDDPSAVPNHLSETGLGDTEGQIRYRFLPETETRPELLGFFELVLPLQKGRKLIGTQHWELAPGLNITKGFRFGTLSLKLSSSYTSDERNIQFGEYALEYVKRLSPAWRTVLAVEGEQDEVAAIGEVQYALAKNAVLKLNCGFGLTKKAPDLAPEVGIVFSF